MKHVHALLPRLFSEIGHIFHYHVAVQRALSLVGWTYTAYIPKKTKLTIVPEKWFSVLANDTSDQSRGFWLKLKFLVANVLPLYKICRTIEKESAAILFIEHFDLHHLVSLGVALFFLKPQFHFWMLHRYELENRRFKAMLYRFFLRYMCKKLGNAKVKCLTDSELLAKSLKNNLQYPISIVPIPHTEGNGKNRKNKEYLQFWWPGGLVREDKGLSKIQKLLLLMKDKQGIRMVTAESSRQIFTSHPKVDFIPTFLTREDYITWMQSADLILLPYSGRDYAKRTSGIFVEAVSFGAIPITTKGTWMAYELGKFQLSELTFDWEEPNFLDLLCCLLENGDMKIKLQRMRSHYRRYHCPEGFMAALQSIQ